MARGQVYRFYVILSSVERRKGAGEREREGERGRMDLIKLEAGPGRMRSSGVAGYFGAERKVMRY